MGKCEGGGKRAGIFNRLRAALDRGREEGMRGVADERGVETGREPSGKRLPGGEFPVDAFGSEFNLEDLGLEGISRRKLMRGIAVTLG